MAQLTSCDGKHIAGGPVLHVDGDVLPKDYAEQKCPVCGQQLRLVWDVRAELRHPIGTPADTGQERA